jgi:hypothetical protein
LLKERKKKLIEELSAIDESRQLAEEERKLRNELQELEDKKPKGKIDKILDKTLGRIWR